MPRLHASTTKESAAAAVSYDDDESPQWTTSVKRVVATTISTADTTHNHATPPHSTCASQATDKDTDTDAPPPLPPPPIAMSPAVQEGLTRRRIMQRRPPPPPPPLRTSTVPNNPYNNRSTHNNSSTNSRKHDWSWWMAMVVLSGVVGWVVLDCSRLGIIVPFSKDPHEGAISSSSSSSSSSTSWIREGELIQRIQEMQNGLAQRAAHVDSRATRMRQDVKGLHEDASESLVELAHGYGIQFEQHVHQFRQALQSSPHLQHEVWKLQHTMQTESERHIQAHFGDAPYKVELQIEGHFPIQVTLQSHHMPHASHLFLNQVRNHLWANMTLERDSNNDLLFQAHLSPEIQQTFRNNLDISGIAFAETDSEEEEDPDIDSNNEEHHEEEEHHDEEEHHNEEEHDEEDHSSAHKIEEHHEGKHLQEELSAHKIQYCVGFVYPDHHDNKDDKPVYPLYIQKRLNHGATPGPCFAHVVTGLEDVEDLFSHTTLQLERASLLLP